MQNGSRFGITWRLSIMTSLLVVTGLCVLSLAIFYTSKNQINERIAKEAESSLKVAVASLSQPMWVFDFKTVGEITTALVNDRDHIIIAVRVITEDQKILVERKAQKLELQSFEALQTLPSHSFFEQSLMHDKQNLGKVQIIFSAEQMDQNLYDMLKAMTVLTASMAVFGSLLIFLVTRRFLAAPLKGLVAIAQKIEKGDYSITDEKWQHEFQILSRAFSNAAHAIQKRDLELKMHAENLEKQIETRTRELDAQRMKMVQSARLASLGELSAGIAHEINNPLAIIQGNADILIKYLGDDVKARMHLEKITSMVKRISKIIKGLRSFARDGSKDPMFTFKAASFLEELKDLCSARLKAHSIDFEVICPHDLQTNGREVQLSQVLVNLINNSMDAVEEAPEKWIRLEVFERQGQIVFAVTDSGTGVPDSLREKIMEPFFTTKMIGKGTGLGLAIAIGIARDHGGDLIYISDYKNTRFELVLPQAQSKFMAA